MEVLRNLHDEIQGLKEQSWKMELKKEEEMVQSDIDDLKEACKILC